MQLTFSQTILAHTSSRGGIGAPPAQPEAASFSETEAPAGAMGGQGSTPLLDLTRLALQAVPKAPKEAPQGRAGGRAAGALGT